MAKELSKTAKASLRVGTGNTRTPCGWIMLKRPGKMETKPYKTFYDNAEYHAYVANMDKTLYTAVAGGMNR